jgi:pimeloyl-ACP methyl ester carboxylesterase
VNETPLYLGDSEPVFAVFHPAVGEASAVLFCPPFGWDDICSYRSRRLWAERLAAAGHPALRFDLPGTGDSAGSADGPDRVAAWVESVEAAATWLQAKSGRSRLTAIGIGLGGLLALRVAANGGPIDDLVLWGVPADGRRLLRELRAFARVEADSILAAGAPPPPAESDNVLAPGGFLVTAATQAGLEALDAGALALSSSRERRVLMLGRDGVPPDEALRKRLEETSAVVETDPGRGYGAMMTPPDLARPPVAVFERVDAWLRQGRGGTLDVRPSAPDARASLDLTVENVRIRETPFAAAKDELWLFGILCEPASEAATNLTLVFLNAGAIRRVGPNRMWVDFARAWAARGVTTLRLDLEGIGDATGDGQRYTDVSELYVPEFVGQVQAALDALDVRLGARRFALLGLCSGAYWGFHSALTDARVRAAIMLNPRVLFWHAELDTVRDARKLKSRLYTRSFWRRTLRSGDAPRLLSLIRWLALAAFRARRSPTRRTLQQIAASFDVLEERNRRAVFIFCDGEPLREELDEGGLLPDAARWPGVELQVVPGRDHTLRPLWMHESVRSAVDRAVTTELARVVPEAT